MKSSLPPSVEKLVTFSSVFQCLCHAPSEKITSERESINFLEINLADFDTVAERENESEQKLFEQIQDYCKKNFPNLTDVHINGPNTNLINKLLQDASANGKDDIDFGPNVHQVITPTGLLS